MEKSKVTVLREIKFNGNTIIRRDGAIPVNLHDVFNKPNRRKAPKHLPKIELD